MSDLREFLLAQGVSEAEIREAEAEGPHGLRLLALERILLPYPGRYTGVELAEKAGVPYEAAQRFWRAMGFVDPPEDEPAFTDGDLEALIGARRLMEQDLADPQIAIQLTRVMGLSLSRVAEAMVEAWRGRRFGPISALNAAPDEEIDRVVLDQARFLLENNERFLVYIWRRHLTAAALRGALPALGRDEPTHDLGVGFADLVGYTRLSQRVEDDELAEIVDRFETTAHETITTLRGRLVKMIGDEVMFVTDDPETLAEIGLTLTERHEEDDILPPVRGGLAWGPVLAREGDYFGATVNLANRAAAVAAPGTVLVSEPLYRALKETERFLVKRVRPRVLKGLGPVTLGVVRRPDGDHRPGPTELVRKAVERIAPV